MSDEYSVGYEEGYQAGWNAAIDAYTTPQPVSQEGIRFVWNGEGWIEADDYIWKTTNDWERRVLYTTPQSELNLNCKSVQKRLATSWGYVLPVKEVELTDDEIQKWIDALPYDPQDLNLRRFARAVIAAHKEKNK